MKAYFKLLLIIPLVFMMVLLPGCEKSLNDITQKYNINNKIKGNELSSDELSKELDSILENFKIIQYGELNVQISDRTEKINMKLQFNITSEDINDCKIYLSIKSSSSKKEYFLKDGYIYRNIDSKKMKNSIVLYYGDSILHDMNAKSYILNNFFSMMDMENITKIEAYNELCEGLKLCLANPEESQIKAVIDSKDNLVIDFMEEKNNGRVVFDENYRMIYVGAKESDNEIVHMSLNYKKPTFNFPSTEDYEDSN